VINRAKSSAGFISEGPAQELDFGKRGVFAFSWVLVLMVGVMPIVEASLHRRPSISLPATIVFFGTVSSSIVLRRSYSWLGIALHIFSQILIWLSIFTMSLALVLYLA